MILLKRKFHIFTQAFLRTLEALANQLTLMSTPSHYAASVEPQHGSDEEENEADEEDDDEGPTDSESISSLLRRLAASPVPIKVHSVQINNSSRTKRELIESVLDLSSILKSSTFQELVYVSGLANARLKRLGVFRSVRITIDAGPDEVPGSSVVVVDVDEAVHPFAGDFFVDFNTEVLISFQSLDTDQGISLIKFEQVFLCIFAGSFGFEFNN